MILGLQNANNMDYALFGLWLCNFCRHVIVNSVGHSFIKIHIIGTVHVHVSVKSLFPCVRYLNILSQGTSFESRNISLVTPVMPFTVIGDNSINMSFLATIADKISFLHQENCNTANIPTSLLIHM